MATSVSGNDAFFDDDDEELLKDLIHGDGGYGGGDFNTRLASLQKRFENDHGHDQFRNEWGNFVSSAEKSGFRVSQQLKPAPASHDSAVFPSAFQTEAGKKHLRATSSILNVSEKRAVQLTLCFLRTVQKNPTNLQHLVGTRSLFLKVMGYHFQQRAARLSVITECLRKEEDSTDPNQNSIVEMLDNLDSTYSMDGCNRGLFRFFLSVACQEKLHHLPGRAQLLSAKELKNDSNDAFMDSLTNFSGEAAWHQYMKVCVESCQDRIRQERRLAIEGLMNLLYSRIEGGIRRVDYMILLIAFQSASFFSNEPVESKRLSLTAGLTCAECTGLWRIFGGPSDVDWVQSHPLLRGVIHGQRGESRDEAIAAEIEIEALLSMIAEMIDKMQQDTAPESLALLSFGLLLQLAYQAILPSQFGADEHGYWQIFLKKGREMVSTASDKYAFESLTKAMELLVSDPTCVSRKDTESTPYDWIFPRANEDSPMELCTDERESDSDSQLCAGIGQEVLFALVYAFQDTILAVDHISGSDNLQLVCDLATVIYRGSPVICRPFWEAYGLTDPVSLESNSVAPLVQIIDAGYKLANKDISSGTQTSIHSEWLLASCCPLVQFLATLCYNAESVEFALSAIPTGVLEKALHVCGTHVARDNNSVFNKNRLSFLRALEMLTNLGASKETRSLTRAALGNNPGMLLSCLGSSDEDVYGPALNIIADLAIDSPVEWLTHLSQRLQPLVATKVTDDRVIYPLSRVYLALAKQMGKVVYHVSDAISESYLNLILRGVVLFTPSLTSCLSNINQESATPLKTVESVLSFFTSLLENISPIMMHRSDSVREVANGIRDATVEKFSNDLGESVFFYAVLPMSMALARAIEGHENESNIARIASTEENSSTSKYGMWHRAATQSFATPGMDSETIKNILDNFDDVVDFDDFGVGNAAYVLPTVSRALQVLRAWAVHANDMIGAAVGLDGSVDRLLTLSPQRLLTGPASLPQRFRTNRKVKALWDNWVHPSNFKLLSTYFRGINGNIAWPFFVQSSCLDLIHGCLSHVKLGLARQRRPNTLLFDKASILDIVALIVPMAAKTVQLKGSHVSDETKNKAVRGILVLRLLGSVVDLFAAELGDSLRELVERVLKSTREKCDRLHMGFSSKGTAFLKDEDLNVDLQVASAGLYFLRSFWRSAGRFEDKMSIAKYYESGNAFFESLATFLLGYSTSQITEKGHEIGSLRSFLAIGVDFLRLASEIVLASGETIPSRILGIFQENPLKLVATSKAFISTDTCLDYATAATRFIKKLSPISTKMTVDNASVMYKLFPVFCVSDGNPGFFHVDLDSFERAVLTITSEEELRPADMSEVAVTQFALISQLSLLHEWRKFVDFLLTRLPANPPNLPQNSGALISADCCSLLSSALQTLETLQENLQCIEASRDDGWTLDDSETSKMARTIAGLGLQLIAESGERREQADPGLTVDVLSQLSVCSSNVLSVLSPLDCFDTEQLLMTGAIGLLNKLDARGVSLECLNTSQADAMIVKFLGTILKLVSLDSGKQPGCLEACVTLLTIFARGGNFFLGADAREDLRRVLELLVIKVKAYSASAMNLESISIGKGVYGSGIELLDGLCNLVLEIRDSAMLDVVCESRLLEMLIFNPLFSDQSLITMAPDRGYISTRERVRPKVHPIHILWRKALRCFHAVATISQNENCQILVADFILAHRNTFVMCLKSLDAFPFTHNALLEATLVYALLASFCGPNRVWGSHKTILNEFLSQSKTLIANLSTFLGASAASRAFFKAIGDADDDNVDSRTASPFNRVHNARHEAIRYSHFSSRCCRQVTMEDFEAHAGQGDIVTTDATDSDKKWEDLMTGAFSKKMEDTGADCLFAAVSFFWNIHPINSSFLMLETAEAARIDFLELLKPNMIIAFTSSVRESQRSSRHGAYSCYVHYAQVIYCNTLDRTWLVRDLESGVNDIVKVNQIIGLEDLSKKQNLTAYKRAPDSAADLVDFDKSISVGHLILALRWCASMPASQVGPVVGQLSVLLGAEISMHAERGSVLKSPKDDVNRLDAQLYELYGDTSGIAGRLKGTLESDVWIALRRQMATELDRAEKEEQACAKILLAEEDESFYMRSSGRNPFSDLQMAYQ